MLHNAPSVSSPRCSYAPDLCLPPQPDSRRRRGSEAAEPPAAASWWLDGDNAKPQAKMLHQRVKKRDCSVKGDAWEGGPRLRQDDIGDRTRDLLRGTAAMHRHFRLPWWWSAGGDARGSRQARPVKVAAHLIALQHSPILPMLPSRQKAPAADRRHQAVIKLYV